MTQAGMLIVNSLLVSVSYDNEVFYDVGSVRQDAGVHSNVPHIMLHPGSGNVAVSETIYQDRNSTLYYLSTIL